MHMNMNDDRDLCGDAVEVMNGSSISKARRLLLCQIVRLWGVPSVGRSGSMLEIGMIYSY
jgi:hypothetical protein